MPIWLTQATVKDLNLHSQGTMSAHLGVEFLEIGENWISARLPVDERTIQPAGILHGGASIALAETLGSTAAYLCVDPALKTVVGIEINANHIRAVRSGFVYGTARPIHLGGSTQVWEIRIQDIAKKLVCICRLTMAVLDRKS